MATAKKQQHRFQTAYSRIRNPKDKKECKDPHLTVKQDSLTLKEIFQRHMRGMVDVQLPQNVNDDEEVDFDSPDYEKFHKMDMAEKEQLVLEKSKAVTEFKALEDRKHREKMAKKEKEAFDKKVEEELAKRQSEKKKED